MQPIEFLKKINEAGISRFGDVYLFGSYAKTDGNQYNDIDLYIDANECDIPNIEKALKLLPYDYNVVPQYYSPMPKPTPTPPWPPKPPKVGRNNILHVTVCSKLTAQEQPFFKTMLEGKHFVVRGSNA